MSSSSSLSCFMEAETEAEAGPCYLGPTTELLAPGQSLLQQQHARKQVVY